MAELRYTYLLDVKDLASRQVAQANARVTKSVEQTNVAMRQQGTVAESAARKVQSAGARQAAEWRQVQRAAQAAERSVAQSATQAATQVTRAVERQVAAQRKQGASYAQIARAQKAAGVSSRETATAIEQSAARERRAYESTAASAAKSKGRIVGGLRRQVSDMKGLATGLVASFGVLKGIQFVGDSVKQVSELARGTVKLSAVTGMDARTASQWLVIAKQRGLAARQLNQSFITLEKNQVKGAAGSKLQAEAFAKLGISQRDLKKLGTEQLIERVADGFQKLGPGAQRAALAQQLFARGGQALIATLGGGGQKIRDMRKVIDEYGASLDAKGVKNAMKLVAAQRTLNLAMLGIKVSLGQALIPLLAKGAAALSTFILQIRQGKGPGGEFRRVIEGMAAGAKDVGAFVKPAVTALAGFVRQHPGIVKVAGALVAVGVAVRALRFAGAISGVTALVSGLAAAAVKARGAAAAIRVATGAGGGRAAAAGAGLASQVKGAAALYAAYVGVNAAIDKLVQKAKQSRNPIVKTYGDVEGFAQKVLRTATQGPVAWAKFANGIVNGNRKVRASLDAAHSDLSGLQRALARPRLDFASAFAAQAGKVRGVMGSLSQRTIQQLAKMRGPLRAQAAQAVVDVTRAMEGMGTKPVGSARRLSQGIQSVLGGMRLQAGRLSRATMRSVVASFGGLANALDGPFRHAQAKFLTFLRNMQSDADRARNIANLTGLPGQGARRRKGGWNYAAGGLVPAMVSPGELIVHGTAGMVVPGPRVAADSVPMLLPAGSAVLTDHGQQLLAQGASISQAVAAQAPHFAKGGFVKVGATVYNDPPPGAYGGSLSMGYAELGTARRTDGGGTGRGWLARALGRKGELPENYPLRVARRADGSGRVAILRKRDRGYGQGGDGTTSDPAYAIDIWRDAWSGLGINGSFKGPVWVSPTSGKLPNTAGGGKAGSGTVSGLQQAMSRRVGRSAKRAGLVDDAFGAGFAQGEQGLTRSRLRYRTDTAYRDIAGAYRLPASKTAGGTGGGGKGGGGGGKDPGYYQRVKNLVGLGNFDGYRVAKWIIPALRYSRAHGGRFQVTSGYRSHATNVAHGRNYHSLHEDVKWPGGAVDFGGMRDQAAFQRRASFLKHLAGYRGPRPKPLYGDDGHVSGTGHRRGGWIGAPIRLRAGTGSVGGPVQVGRVTHQETTGPGIPAFGKRLQDAVARALTWQAGTLDRLNTTIQAAAERKLGQLRNRLQQAVRRGGTEAAVKRLQAALDLVDKELGRRAGLLARRITQRAAGADRAQARGEIGLRLAGIDPEDPQGLAARLRVEAAKGKGLHRTGRDLEGELRLARRARDLDRITDLKGQIADNQTAILESRASQRELARARAQAQRDARTAFAASLTDIASSRVSLAQTGLQRVELEQRLAGTYDTGGRARADYITNQIIPQLQSERDQIRAQGVEAMRQNNADLARQLRQAWEEKGNDILQAQLDAQEETARNTADTADALKNLGGTLSFEFQGSRLTDDLLASGVGA